MTSKKLKIGLIGCGGMAKFYRNVYTNIEGAELAFIVGLEADNPQELAKELNCQNYSTDYRDCLNSDVDIVDISTPNFLHAEQFLAAVNADKHVLLQKPIAASEADAVSIMTASLDTKKKTGMFMSKRCQSSFNEIRKIVRSGTIGTVSSIHTRAALKRKTAAAASNWRSSIEKTGGGALIQLAIHDYDIMQWILGERIETVSAFCENLMSPNIGGDDTAQSIVKFQSGILGCVEASYCSKNPRIDIYGDKGSIFFDGTNVTLSAENTFEGTHIKYDTSGTPSVYNMREFNDTLFQADNPYEQHIAFVRAVMENTPVSVPISEGFNDFVIVKAAYKSAETGSTVSIEKFRNEMLAKYSGGRL